MKNVTTRYPSPYQPKPRSVAEVRKIASNINHKENPIRALIEKCVGSHTLTAKVVEDVATIDAMKRDGVVAFLCTLTKNGEVISEGRGSAIINPSNNRYVSRAIYSAFNGAISDSVVKAAKVYDSIRNVESAAPAHDYEPITPKQREYLLQLASLHLSEADRENYASSVSDMTKQEASEAIKSFAL